MFPPSISLLEAQIKEICAQLEVRNLDWFKNRAINVHDKGYYFILSRDLPVNHWNILCNGLIVSRSGTLVCLPPIRPFNLNESTCCVNIKNCDLIEKIPGQTINLFYPIYSKDLPFYSTKTEISSKQYAVFGPLDSIKPYMERIKFLASDTNYCFTYKFHKEKLFLINGRSLRHQCYLHEFSEQELDVMANRMEVERPATFKCTSDWNYIKNIMSSKPGLYLLRDLATGERAIAPYVSPQEIPVARPKRVQTGKYKHLIPYWKENQHQDIIQRFPALKEQFDEMESRFVDFKESTKQVARFWLRKDFSKKVLAQELEKRETPWMRKIILLLSFLHPERWDYAIRKGFCSLSQYAIQDMLDLKN